VNEFLLRFPGPPTAEHALGTGEHGIGRVGDGGPLGLVDARQAAVRICLDRKGAWLHVDEGAGGVHVNGRPVRRLAMLRGGDTIFVDGVELALVTPPRRVAAGSTTAASENDPRVVLRGVGGRYHGRSFTLERARLVGRAGEADIRLDDSDIAERHARLELRGELVQLRDLAGEGSLVNGERVRDALLHPGDQVVFDAQHRFVVEAPGHKAGSHLPVAVEDDAVERAIPPTLARSARRLPWLLLAALLLAGALSALLLFGSPA
jgi:pSer/pThr/pTyr-binding forkhead associated (FHA) protein